MLFDLRGRGRRRTVKIVYITLALLMGGGLVLFGIGGGGAMQGGLVDAITGSSGGDTGAERFEKKEKAALAATGARRRIPTAWAELARARVQTAGFGENFDPNTATYTAAGKAKLTQAADAWNKYLELDPKNPDDRVAGLMVRAFDQTGLNRPADAAKAQEIITEAQAERHDVRDARDLRLPGRRDPQGRPRPRPRARPRAQGRAQHAQEPAGRGQAAGARPAGPAAGPGVDPDSDAHAQALTGG